MAQPGEVLASSAIADAAGDAPFGLERIDDAELKGFPGAVALFRVTRNGSGPLVNLRRRRGGYLKPERWWLLAGPKRPRDVTVTR
jgi:class 3 adenylate cyclase